KFRNRSSTAYSLQSIFCDLPPKAAVAVASFHDNDEAMPFRCQAIGPTNSVYPALLNRTSADYVPSGRITSLAIDPRCRARREEDDGDEESHGCRIFVGAAGGGIWRTNNALSRRPHWSFIS